MSERESLDEQVANLILYVGDIRSSLMLTETTKLEVDKMLESFQAELRYFGQDISRKTNQAVEELRYFGQDISRKTNQAVEELSAPYREGAPFYEVTYVEADGDSLTSTGPSLELAIRPFNDARRYANVVSLRRGIEDIERDLKVRMVADGWPKEGSGNEG